MIVLCFYQLKQMRWWNSFCFEYLLHSTFPVLRIRIIILVGRVNEVRSNIHAWDSSLVSRLYGSSGQYCIFIP